MLSNLSENICCPTRTLCLTLGVYLTVFFFLICFFYAGSPTKMSCLKPSWQWVYHHCSDSPEDDVLLWQHEGMPLQCILKAVFLIIVTLCDNKASLLPLTTDFSSKHWDDESCSFLSDWLTSVSELCVSRAYYLLLQHPQKISKYTQESCTHGAELKQILKIQSKSWKLIKLFQNVHKMFMH